MNVRRVLSILICVFVVAVPVSRAAGADSPATGPETEHRFPKLTVPPGFTATLFACDPLVEYPSVIAVGPRVGSVFVAHDYMTGLGTEIIRRDEIRLLEDTDGDGYADQSTVFAKEFNSIQGLAFFAGTVFAMHAPFLTALRDTNGDGVADERRDLLTGLGLTPEKNPVRLHCANGVAAGHDGWLYLAMGDNGTDVQRPEGDRLVLNGGGILRCRRDGHDLHVFSMGLRNIYDVVLDDQLNVFVRDNENDGGDYMIRVCHCFHGSDHGYPYLYRDHPDEAMVPMADLGRGSSAGGICYLETALPSEYRGNLFFCEWGRAIVRYARDALGSGFAATHEIDFAAGAATDPYGFKPTDIIVDRDGSLLISDWCDGQRPKRGRGRIYRIAYSNPNPPQPTTSRTTAPAAKDLLQRLDSSSYFERVQAQTAFEQLGAEGVRLVLGAIQKKTLGVAGRLHAIWILATAGRESVGDLFEIVGSDPDSSVRAQAVRAIADLTDPVFVERKLDPGRGDSETASRLARLADGADPKTVREIVIALGRLRRMPSVDWWNARLKSSDSALAHAAMQTLRRCEDWPTVLTLLDQPDDSPMRTIALRALAERADVTIVDGLIDRLMRSKDSPRRLQYAELLARVYKRPGPWTYWGYRPEPRPANTVAWERTDEIARVVDKLLSDDDFDVRVAVLRRMQRERIPTQLQSLTRWVGAERDEKRVDAILDSLTQYPAADVQCALRLVVLMDQYAEANRLRACSLLIKGLDDAEFGQLFPLAEFVEDGPVLQKLIVELGKHPGIDCHELLMSKLYSIHADIRATAIEALSALHVVEPASKIVELLDDPSPAVRRVAALAVGNLGVRESIASLLKLVKSDDMPTRAACLESLRLLRDPSAIAQAVAALENPATQLAAMNYLADFGGPEQTKDVMAVAASSRSAEVLTGAVRALAAWEAKVSAGSSVGRELHSAIAAIQGESGLLLDWRTSGSCARSESAKLRESIAAAKTPAAIEAPSDWRPVLATGIDARVDLGLRDSGPPDPVWFALSDLMIAQPTNAQFLASSNGTLQVWLNGRSVYHREKESSFQLDSDRFQAELTKGVNRLIVEVGGVRDVAQFHLRFRRLSTSADHERIAQYALQNAGDTDRGRALFSNPEKSACLKCHRLNEQGGRIGPDLTGVGSRFSRIHLIESILEPSRTIAPSYETIAVVLTSGRIVTGVKITENDSTLTLADDQAKPHEIPKNDIEERVKQARSTMPDGLEKRFSDREFLDLVTFLVSQKKKDAQ